MSIGGGGTRIRVVDDDDDDDDDGLGVSCVFCSLLSSRSVVVGVVKADSTRRSSNKRMAVSEGIRRLYR